MSQDPNGKSAEAGMQTEVVAKAKRRQYPVEYKLRILREVEECKGAGEVGALLRREGLYSSLVSKWREQRERGSLTGVSGQRRGPKVDSQAKELERLQRENKRLQEKLERAELIIDVQKKVARLLGVPLEDNNQNEDS
jgi:transposase-like protein